MCEEYNYGEYEEILWEFLEIFFMIFGEELRITFSTSHRGNGGAVGLLELNSFTGFLYRCSRLDTLQNTYFVEHLFLQNTLFITPVFLYLSDFSMKNE